MGHHINKDGEFQSDKHPELPPNKIALDFRDAFARLPILMYAQSIMDEELAMDIYKGLENAKSKVELPD